MLKRFTELTPVNRCEPCQEYPGVWYVYVQGEEVFGARTFDAAYAAAEHFCNEYDGIPERVQREEPLRISISWSCSDNDPRVGEVWFTGYYRHGRFNQFGQYVS